MNAPGTGNCMCSVLSEMCFCGNVKMYLFLERGGVQKIIQLCIRGDRRDALSNNKISLK